MIKLPTAANVVGADDGSELHVFLDGKEATKLRQSGNVITSTSNTYLKQFEIQTKTSTSTISVRYSMEKANVSVPM